MVESTLLIIGLLASLITLITYLLPKDQPKIWRAGILGILTLLVGLIVYQAEQLDRHRDAEKAARAILKGDYTDEGFVQAGLVYLEKHRTLFPDTYARMKGRFDSWACNSPGSGSVYGNPSSECAYRYTDFKYEMQGTLEGIAAIQG